MTPLSTSTYLANTQVANQRPPSAPVRLLISLLLLAYSFLFSPSSPIFRDSTSVRGRMAHPSASLNNAGYAASTWGGDGLKNRVFFAFAFVEVISWFWILVTLREEKQSLAKKRGSAAKRRVSSSRM